ncbi:MAG TPA: hypothetical protein VJY40_01685 [Corynebacterium sp.]|jgi:hypothetical protein|nr:hypothetical protein [Corynebacterium sp.]
MRTLYYPAQQGRQADLCRTLAASILNLIRAPEAAEQYKLGFTAANLRAEGVEIPAGAMNLLEVRGWIARSPEWTKTKPRAAIWMLTPEAVRFLDDHGLAAATGGVTA